MVRMSHTWCWSQVVPGSAQEWPLVVLREPYVVQGQNAGWAMYHKHSIYVLLKRLKIILMDYEIRCS